MMKQVFGQVRSAEVDQHWTTRDPCLVAAVGSLLSTSCHTYPATLQRTYHQLTLASIACGLHHGWHVRRMDGYTGPFAMCRNKTTICHLGFGNYKYDDLDELCAAAHSSSKHSSSIIYPVPGTGTSARPPATRLVRNARAQRGRLARAIGS